MLKITKKVMLKILRNSEKKQQNIATNHKKEKHKQNMKRNEKYIKDSSIVNTISCNNKL